MGHTDDNSKNWDIPEPLDDARKKLQGVIHDIPDPPTWTDQLLSYGAAFAGPVGYFLWAIKYDHKDTQLMCTGASAGLVVIGMCFVNPCAALFMGLIPWAIRIYTVSPRLTDAQDQYNAKWKSNQRSLRNRRRYGQHYGAGQYRGRDDEDPRY